MKTRNLLLSLMASIITTSLAFAGNYKVEKDQSNVKWLGKKVTGEHYGTISFENGHLHIEDGNITSGEFVIDMNSIVVEDLTDAEWNQKLVGHLKSDDFFSTDKFGTSKLVLKSVEAKSGNVHHFKGHLTIKGITHPVEFDAAVEFKGNHVHANGKMTIDRSLYNVKYGSGKFFDNLGDKMIYDDFTLDFNIVATK